MATEECLAAFLGADIAVSQVPEESLLDTLQDLQGKAAALWAERKWPALTGELPSWCAAYLAMVQEYERTGSMAAGDAADAIAARYRPAGIYYWCLCHFLMQFADRYLTERAIEVMDELFGDGWEGFSEEIEAAEAAAHAGNDARLRALEDNKLIMLFRLVRE
jgi:hypothetical protein